MVEPGEDAGFVQIRFHILGASDSFRVRHLDRHGAVELVVVGEIDPSEAALSKQPDHPIATDLRRISTTGTGSGSLGTIVGGSGSSDS